MPFRLAVSNWHRKNWLGEMELAFLATIHKRLHRLLFRASHPQISQTRLTFNGPE